MSEMPDSDEAFELEPPAREADRLTLDLDGWEGPLDLLLTLARAQKVDLARISILVPIIRSSRWIASSRVMTGLLATM